MRAKHSALILTAGFLLIPTLSWSQFPGGGSRDGGRTQFDPDQLFNLVARGQDVIRVNELDPMARAMFDRFASRLGLGGNEITRDQFRTAMDRVRQGALSGESGGMSFRMMPGSGSGGPMGLQFGTPGGGFGDSDRRMEEYFKRLDVNEDGELENDELIGDRVVEALQAERDKYDTNHNGAIDLAEFKAYFLARNGPQDGMFRGPEAPGLDGERRRPTLIRGNNLPRDFPYASLDTDADGQIGLYEWKVSGSRVSEFVKMDKNSDGFLTVDEYYGWRKEEAQKNGSFSDQFVRGGFGRGPSQGLGIMEQGTSRSFSSGQGFTDPRMMAMNSTGSGFDRGFGGDRGRGPGGFGDRGPGGFSFGGDRGPGGFSFGDRGPGSFGGDRGPGGRGERGPGGFGDRGPGGFGDRGPGGFGDRGQSGFGMTGPSGDRMRGPSGFGPQSVGGPSQSPFGGPAAMGNGMTPPGGGRFGQTPGGFGQPMGPDSRGPGASDGGGRRGARGPGGEAFNPSGGPGGPRGGERKR
jgi:hypothetical protein